MIRDAVCQKNSVNLYWYRFCVIDRKYLMDNRLIIFK